MANDTTNRQQLELPIIPGSLCVKAPIWESREGGKNWLATIWADERKRGGIARSFFGVYRADDGGEYGITNLRYGAAVEMGADYPGRRNRRYGVCVSHASGSHLKLIVCASASEAIALSRSFAFPRAQ